MSNGSVRFVGESNDHFGLYSNFKSMAFSYYYYSNNELKMYVDGALIDSTNLGTDLNTDGIYHIVVGSNTISRNDEYFGGKVAHVSIWDRVLSAIEIQEYVELPTILQCLRPTWLFRIRK